VLHRVLIDAAKNVRLVNYNQEKLDRCKNGEFLLFFWNAVLSVYAVHDYFKHAAGHDIFFVSLASGPVI
jgi:hypothetical protein